MSDCDNATKEYVRDAITAERNLTNEMFKQRDKAIELLASKTPTVIAVAAFLLALLSYLKGPTPPPAPCVQTNPPTMGPAK